MSSSAFARTRDHTDARFERFDEMLRSSLERLEKEARYVHTLNFFSECSDSHNYDLHACDPSHALLLVFGRRQRRAEWKAFFGGQAAGLVVAFGGLCYIADNNRV
jgi:hypothetical protein